MSSVGGNGGDERDPLLVRPFVLQDDEPREDAPSAATWPEGPKHEAPTQVLPAVPSAPPQPRTRGRSRRPHRPALLIGAGVAAVLAVAGYTIVRPALRPAVSTSLPDQSLPVVTGPGLPSSTPDPGDQAGGTANGGAASGGDANGGAANGGAANGGDAQDTNGAGDGPSAGASGSAGSSPGREERAAATTTPATPPAAGTATTVPATKTATAPAGLVPPSPLVSLEGALVSGNGLCLDLQGGDAGDGREVHVDDCNGTSPQRWQLNGDRTLEVLDMCAYMVGDSTVELIRCDTRNPAQWSINRENGQVTNAANGQCLTDPFFGGRPGNRVVVARCTGLNNQRWTFR
ncbi:RICIN domain-containing protein [Actinoplanes sp. NPDC023714]|uniref:RICIN domain-containing protein n=1 Tax=Actinoplanes sp. NPDC023714 TaxID=3154322 RepID=UPI0033DC8BD5